MITTKITRILVFITALIIIQSCNSIFYQPDREVYINPEDENVKFNDVFIDSYDGKKIHLWIFPCKGKAKGTIVQFHGNAENMTSHFLSLFWVTEHDYNFISFDYRGYGESEGVVERSAIRKDSLAVMRYIKKLDKDFLGDKLIYHGQSLGGIILMESLLSIEPDFLPKAAILESTFYSYREVAFEQLKKQWFSALLIPLAFILITDEGAPVHSMSKLPQIPYLVIHGDADRVISYKFGQSIFEKIPAPAKTFMKIQNGKHIQSFHTRENQANYINFLNSL